MKRRIENINYYLVYIENKVKKYDKYHMKPQMVAFSIKSEKRYLKDFRHGINLVFRNKNFEKFLNKEISLDEFRKETKRHYKINIIFIMWALYLINFQLKNTEIKIKKLPKNPNLSLKRNYNFLMEKHKTETRGLNYLFFETEKYWKIYHHTDFYYTKKQTLYKTLKDERKRVFGLFNSIDTPNTYSPLISYAKIVKNLYGNSIVRKSLWTKFLKDANNNWKEYRENVLSTTKVKIDHKPRK